MATEARINTENKFAPDFRQICSFSRAHQDGGRLRDPNCVRPSVRDAYKNLNNFPTLHLIVTKLDL